MLKFNFLGFRMKKILFLLVTGFLISNLFGQNEVTRKFSGTAAIDWDYVIRDGTTTTLTAGQDTISVLGASDTLVSRYWSQWGGDMNIQLDLYGGTPSIYFKVQAANKSSYFADSSFTTFGYLEYAGGGIGNNYFTEDSVEVTSSGLSMPILVPPLGSDVFRILAYSDGSQSGNTLLKAILKRTKIQ